MARLFVSVDIPGSLDHELRRLQNQLDNTNADLNIVSLDKIHITLKFLGDTDPDRVDEIENVMKDSVKNIDPFDVDLDGVGVFPARDYITVVWAGVSRGTNPLTEIHRNLEEKLVERELADPEDHDFTPHATLARMKSGRGKSEIHDFLDKNNDRSLGIFTLNTIQLMKSNLKSNGPQYSVVKQIQL